MSSSYANIDPQYLAQQYTQIDRAAKDQRFDNQRAEYNAELKAISTLESQVKALDKQLDAFTEDGAVVANQVLLNQEGPLSATADSTAIPGSYQIFVEQVAQAHQVAITLNDSDPLPTDGELTLSLGSESMTLDLTSLPAGATLNDLTTAINSAADNPGVSAAQIRNNGTTYLVLSSNETGAANNVALSFAPASDPQGATFATAVGNSQELTAAQDARIRLGSTTALPITSSSNQIDDVIDGVSLDIQSAQAAGDAPLKLEVRQDLEQTRQNLNDFVASYNQLTASIRDNEVLANDSSARSLLSSTRSQFQKQYDSQTLYSIGLEFDRNGTLSLDNSRLDKALSKDPSVLNRVIGGENGLAQSLDKTLSPYSDRYGILSDRRENIQAGQKRLEQQQQRHNYAMEQRYQRYLNEFTNMQTTIAQLESSMGQI